MVYESQLLNNALQSLEILPNENGLSIATVNPDSEPVIIINPNTRVVNIPDELRNIGVAGDNNCETVYFLMPRYFDNEDLSTKRCLIRFLNSANEYGETEVTQIKTDDDEIKFGWTIDNRVTRYSGTIYFTVQFESENYQWQTTPGEFNIQAGLIIESEMGGVSIEIIDSLRNQIQELQNEMNEMKQSMNTVMTYDTRISSLESDVETIANSAAYIRSA